MKVLAFLIFIIVLPSISYSQNFLTYKAEESHSWDDAEKNAPKELIDSLFKTFPDEFELFEDDDSIGDFSLIDVNRDGRMDVIFDGAIGDAIITIIFINNGKSYIKWFEELGDIEKAEMVDSKLTKLYLNEMSCCGDYLGFNKIYECNFDSLNCPSFKQTFQETYVVTGMIPDTLLNKPISFEVVNDAYNLRFNPVVDDTASSFDFIGNVIGKLKKGSQGMAYAKTMDSTGKNWWFVEMDFEDLYPETILYSPDGFPTKVLGWVSSRFIKPLN